mmetsp:Transcript_268/g.272  ORF Transcript_268/g.272 Transcript_268/m.272 type:complete len:971 (-) Transcript_268:1297-4209(-)
MGKKENQDVIVGKNGQYKILERLGKGGRGVVYKSLMISEGLHVAVKRVLREQLTAEEERALHYEIELLKNLEDEFVVIYYEAIDDPNSKYLDIVMEYVEGGSLEQLVNTVAKVKADSLYASGCSILLEEKLIARFVKQILQGLLYLHKQGVIHRDIKGANILITKDRRVKLSDFGVSVKKHVHPAEEEDLDAVGTPYWMAPEIISLTGVSTESDIWSLGCTIVELLTGVPPYGDLNEFSAMYRIVTDDRPPLPGDISPALEDFLLKCFSKDIATRATAEQLLKHRWILENAAEASVSASQSDEFDTNWDDDDQDLLEDENGIGADSQKMALSQYQEREDDTDDWITLGDEHEQLNDGALAEETDWASDLDFGDDPIADKERERERGHVEKWEEMKRIAARLLDESPLARVRACSELRKIFIAHPVQKSNFLVQPGLLPILENLEDPLNEKVLESVLLLLNGLMEEENEARDVTFQMLHRSATFLPGLGDSSATNLPKAGNLVELLCLSGLVPVIIPLCDRVHLDTVRLSAGRFLQQMTLDKSSVRTLCACRASSGFISLLDTDMESDAHMEMVQIGISGIKSILMNADRAFFTRRMCHEGALGRLAACISWISRKGAEEEYQSIRFEAAEVIQIFAKRPDPLVKKYLSDEEVLGTLVEALDAVKIPDLEPSLELFLSSILDLARDPLSHTPLQNADVIPRLVGILDTYHESYANHTCSALVPKMMTEVISTLSLICRVSSKRQELACVAGVIPHLQWFIRNSGLLKAWSLDLYAGLAMVSSRTREELWKHDGLDFYVEILESPTTLNMYIVKILQSLLEWLENEKERVEKELLRSVTERPDRTTDPKSLFLKRIMPQSNLAITAGLDAMLESLVNIVQFSEVASRIIVDERLLRLMVSYIGSKTPRLQILMLRLIRISLDNGNLTPTLSTEVEMTSVLEDLVEQQHAITVTEQAGFILALVRALEAGSSP